jgi:SAM-dependent methyltransferase
VIIYYEPAKQGEYVTRAINRLPRRSLATANYLSRTRLEQALERNLAGLEAGIVLDLGSGKRYYEAFFDKNTKYIALDIGLEDRPDVVALGEMLPIASQSVDLIICIQVLEHVCDPSAVISEMYRILRPGGTLLLTTHGTMFYHPTPNDYWRWTETGLEKIFREHATFSQLNVEPIMGTFETLGYFHAWYAKFLLSKIASTLGVFGFIAFIIMSLIIIIINLGAMLTDRLIPILSKSKQPGTLIGLYLVRAIR